MPQQRKERSIRKPVTMEEIEYEEGMSEIPSLSEDVPYILMEENEYQRYVETQKNAKSDKQPDPPKKKSPQKKDEPSSSSEPQEFRGMNRRREKSQRRSTLGNEEDILIAAMASAPEDIYIPPPEDPEEAEMLAKLRDEWEDKEADILNGVLNRLPSCRKINHE